MDQHSEVEAKFKADGLGVAQVEEFVMGMREGYWKLRQYRRAIGVDTFYRVGEGTVRSRRDEIVINRLYYPFIGDNKETVDLVRDGPDIDCWLTVKKRKSADQIFDRKEVDLHVGDLKPEDVAAFVGLLGGREEFRIHKSYWVWNLRFAGWRHDRLNDTGIEVCLALYDACNPDGTGTRRFLEAEVEKHSDCSPSEGLSTLDTWVKGVRERFGLEKPVNRSLYEMYQPGGPK